MYNEFDNQLSNRIKQVFDNYEDEGVDMGWEKLKGQLTTVAPKSRTNTWYKAVAAIVLLGLGAWAMLHFRNNEAHIAQLSQTQQKVSTINTLPLNTINTQTVQIAKRKRSASLLSSSSKTTPSYYISETSNTPTDIKETAVNTDNNFNESELASILNTKITLPQGTNKETSSNQVYANNNLTNGEQEPILAQISEEEHHRIMGEKLALLEKKGIVNNNVNSYLTAKHKEKMVDMAVTAGSFVNYSEGSKATVNPSIGISSEIRLSNRLRMGTGLMLAQNNLRYSSNNNPKAETAVMSAIARPVSSDAPTLGVLGQETRALSYSASGYDASLTGLDIPLNLKYIISEARNDIYVAAGVSSNYFFSENYTYHYQSASTSGARTQEAIGRTGSSFNLARMLNVSVGMGYPVGQKNKLSFEPFIKYPLGDMGTQNIQFGSAGLNVKFNFGSSR